MLFIKLPSNRQLSYVKPGMGENKFSGMLSHCFISGHVQDELIIECSKAVLLEIICEQMGRTPSQAEGLVMRADGYEKEFYKKD